MTDCDNCELHPYYATDDLKLLQLGLGSALLTLREAFNAGWKRGAVVSSYPRMPAVRINGDLDAAEPQITHFYGLIPEGDTP